MINPIRWIASKLPPRQVVITEKILQAGTGVSASYPWSSNTASGEKFTQGLSASGRSIMFDHYRLRMNARAAMYDSSQGKALVDRFADIVVDTGLKLKPTPKYDILGIDPDVAEKWGEDVAERFHLWAKSKNSHRSGINNYYQNQRLYEIFQQRDNDVFVRLYYSSDTGLINPLQIEFIDPNQIRGYSYTSTYAMFPHDDGIKRDNQGRETGYKVWGYNWTDSKYIETDVPSRGPKSGRIFMLHGFNPEFAGQGRGYSRIAHALQELEEITDFSLAQLKKAINQSSIVMYTQPSKDAPASNPLAGRTAGPVRQYGSAPQPDLNAENVTPESLAPIVNWQSMPEATITDPGSVGVFNLKGGEDLKAFPSTAPSEAFDIFVHALFSYLCAASGMPVEVVLMKFNSNYSASRAAIVTAWRTAMIWRNEQNSDFNDPIYEMWLSEEIAAGRIQAPGWSDPWLRSAWLCAEWDGAPMINIDPVKEAAGHKAYIELNAETYDDVARAYNGSSGKSNRAKLKRQTQEVVIPPWGSSGSDNLAPDEKDNGAEDVKPVQKNNKNPRDKK
jgi:capsid protein